MSECHHFNKLNMHQDFSSVLVKIIKNINLFESFHQDLLSVKVLRGYKHFFHISKNCTLKKMTLL